MPQFLVIAHEAPTAPDFSLDDLPGAGRIDVLCRCVTAAFLRSHGIRTAVQVYLVIQDAVTIRLEGTSLRHLNPDERSTGALLRKALAASDEAVGHMEVESSPGVHVSTRGLDPVLASLEDHPLVLLAEDGPPITHRDPSIDPVYVLSDHRDPTDEEEALLTAADADRVSLGPTAIHANHAITVVHNYHDTAGYTDYQS